MHIPSIFARIIGLLALATALAGCSTIKLGYNNLDEVAFWWLDGYLDFTDQQAGLVRQDLDRLHLWHRTHELPRLVSVLRGIEELAPNDVSATQVCAFVPQLQERFDALADRAEPAAVTLVLGLTPDQLSHLERKYEKNNADYRKEWIRPAQSAQNRKRFEKWQERGETLYGRLDEPQRDMLRRQAEQSIFDPARILAERQRRQQDALQTLRKLAGQPVELAEARRQLRAYLERARQSPDAAYRSYQQALIEESCRGIAAVHNSTSAAQREAAVRRLRAYQRDLRELSAQP